MKKNRINIFKKKWMTYTIFDKINIDLYQLTPNITCKAERTSLFSDKVKSRNKNIFKQAQTFLKS